MNGKIEQILAKAIDNNWFAVFTSDEAKELSDGISERDRLIKRLAERNTKFEAQLYNLRERCAELESRLDLGTGNMYDVVVLENEKLQEENTRLRDAVRLAVEHRNTLRLQIESEQAVNREHVQQARRLIAERDEANERAEKALDWLMAKHGGRLDAAESIDGPLYDILEGK